MLKLASQRRFAAGRADLSRRPRSFQRLFAVVLAGLVLVAVSDARAAFVTTNEAGVDAIYSQGSFGGNVVDIVFHPTVTLNNGDLLNINNETRLNTLFAFNDGDPDNVVSLYFVDTLDWCGSFNILIVGCATLGGNDLVVESVFAAGAFGAELIAHEIGHSLDLDHVDFANLMTGVINGNVVLTDSQVATILGSSRLQIGDGLRYLEVTPVLVAPIPPAGIMFVSAILALVAIRRRRQSTA